MIPVRRNQNVRIEFEESKLHKEQLICRVLKVHRDSITLDSTDMNPYYTSLVYEGKEVKVYIHDRGGIIILDSMVLTSPADGEFLIELPPNHKNIQRRKYTRAYTALPVVLKTQTESINATTIDIGGGGIRINSKTPLLPGTSYVIFLYLTSSDIAFARGEIETKPHLPENEFIVSFTNIDEKNRDKIIKRCLVLESIKLKEQKREEQLWAE